MKKKRNANYKLAKPCYRNYFWIGTKSFCSAREKSLAQDEMHKPYVRAKRNANNLPDSWDDTKFITLPKSWKHRCRKKKQWAKHKYSKYGKYLSNIWSWDKYQEESDD